jgi:hypothetical protein
MNLNHRLSLLEKKMQLRLRHQAEIEKIWEFRYRLWREQGFPRMPPRTEPLTLDQFKAVFRQAYLPGSRPPRRPRKSGDTP